MDASPSNLEIIESVWIRGRSQNNVVVIVIDRRRRSKVGRRQRRSSELSVRTDPGMRRWICHKTQQDGEGDGVYHDWLMVFLLQLLWFTISKYRHTNRNSYEFFERTHQHQPNRYRYRYRGKSCSTTTDARILGMVVLVEKRKYWTIPIHRFTAYLFIDLLERKLCPLPPILLTAICTW